MNKRIIAFDMDGTIADLYSVKNWLPKLLAEDASPYREARPMWDMRELRKILLRLNSKGWEIRIISWTSEGASPAYKKEIRAAKLEWLHRYNFPAEVVHIVEYGTTKADCVRKHAEVAILIDDNRKVRNGWHLGRTIDPQKVDILEELKKL